jgi:hypothetical protein
MIVLIHHLASQTRMEFSLHPALPKSTSRCQIIVTWRRPQWSNSRDEGGPRAHGAQTWNSFFSHPFPCSIFYGTFASLATIVRQGHAEDAECKALDLVRRWNAGTSYRTSSHSAALLTRGSGGVARTDPSLGTRLVRSFTRLGLVFIAAWAM